MCYQPRIILQRPLSSGGLAPLPSWAAPATPPRKQATTWRCEPVCRVPREPCKEELRARIEVTRRELHEKMSELRRLEQSLRCYEDVESETTGLTSTPESPLKKAVATDTDDLFVEMIIEPRELKEEEKALEEPLEKPREHDIVAEVLAEEQSLEAWEEAKTPSEDPREEPIPKTPPSQEMDLDSEAPREPKAPEPCVEESLELQEEPSVDALAGRLEAPLEPSAPPASPLQELPRAAKEAPAAKAKVKVKPEAKRVRSSSGSRMAVRLHEPISARLRESRGLEQADVARLVASPEIGPSRRKKT